jgi:hypothetical protein
MEKLKKVREKAQISLQTSYKILPSPITNFGSSVQRSKEANLFSFISPKSLAPTISHFGFSFLIPLILLSKII